MRRCLRPDLLAAALSILCLPAPAAAEAEWTFKRVRPGEAPVGRMIDIRVDPAAPPRRVLGNRVELPPAAPGPDRRPVAGAVPADGAAGWFWSVLSPARAAAAPNRLAQAVQVVDAAPGRPGGLRPEAQTMLRLAERWGAEVVKAATGTRVSPALALAVMVVESGGRPAIQSPAGAVGLMQLMPGTAQRFAVTDRTDPAQSIRGGIAYLDWLLGEFGGDPLLALAAYNAGEGAVARHGGVPPFDETRAYVPKVVGAWAQARLLCTRPPVRASDPCLFTGLSLARR